MFNCFRTSSTITNTLTNSNTSDNFINNQDFIDSITCPITAQPMTDPVIGSDGHTYERDAIERWLSNNSTSPQTREYMTSSSLKVNTSMRFLCDKYHSNQNNLSSLSKTSSKITTDHIKLIHSTHTNNHKNSIMLSFDINENTFPKNINHLSQDIILVIDHSGSMAESVEAKDSDGNQLENGFSILDIVKHAANTIIKTIDKNSRLSIIIFDNEIDILLPLNFMTEINQTRAISIINTIIPRGQTNIYGAIEKAIEILDNRDDQSNNGAIIMLTDGIPNISPARGEVETLKRLRIVKNFTSPIYTFGFGYNLKKQLLYDISKYANGANGHIPDGGMIATVFCNFIANILTTVAINLQLHIQTPNIAVLGDFASNYQTNSETTIYDIGNVHIQQARNIILNVPSPNTNIKYFYTYKIGNTSYKSNIFTCSPITCSTINTFNYHNMRFYTIQAIRIIINLKKNNNHNLASKELNNLITALQNNKDKFTNSLLCNIAGDSNNIGQVKIAIENSLYYTKWGEHYLDQLSRCLNQQIKPNFKDIACDFGGHTFNDIVEKSSDIFDTLPPPKPSNINKHTFNYSNTYRSLSSVSSPVNMSNYNNPNGGCFTGDSIIKLSNGTKKFVKDLTKGDTVLTLLDPYDIHRGTSTANIVCILKITTSGNVNLVTTQNGLKITPWHPIVSFNKWCHPANIFETKIHKCTEIYTILLDNYYTFNLNNHWVIGIGHNYNYGILYHQYFGSNKIINDISIIPGWNNGFVVISYNDFIRDSYTNQISGIYFKNRNYTPCITNYTTNSHNNSIVIY